MPDKIKPLKQRLLGHAPYIGASLILLVVSANLVDPRSISDTELGILYAFNRLPEWLAYVFTPITWLGSLTTGVAFGVIFLAKRWARLGIQMVCASLIASLMVNMIKLTGFRQRPGLLLNDIIIRDHSNTPWGFPSGHTAVAVALAFIISRRLPRSYKYIPWIVAALIAISRMYLGMHAPFDLVGGLAVGIIVGAAVDACISYSVPRSSGEPKVKK